VLLTAALAVSLGLTALPVTAGAAFDSSGNGSNTIRVHFTPGGNTFSTGTDEFSITRQGYRLYRIAGISQDGKHFVPDNQYVDVQGTPITTTMNPNNAYEVLRNKPDIIRRLGTFINQTSPEPDYAANFVNGVATFTRLPDGLYLGTGPSATYGNTTYTPAPFLICLPYQANPGDTVPAGSGVQAGVLYSDLDVTVKPTQTTNNGGGGNRTQPPTNDTTPPPDDTTPPPDNTTPPPDDTTPPPDVNIPDEPVPLVDIPDEPTPQVEIPDQPTPRSPATPPKTTPNKPNKPKLPQTGALWWPVPVMGGGGAVLMCAGLVGRRKTK